jgi:site-specific DNA-methyltransferase (adenine-specific)
MNRPPVDRILCGDAFALILDLPDESVNLVITSPPYFHQREYLSGGNADELGREKRVGDYLDRLLTLFRECVRVVRSDGSVVVNLGDASRNGSLLGIPCRFAAAALDTGLVRLVNEVTWVKRNVRPRGHRRRLLASTEPFFHFAKSERYAYHPEDFLADEPAGDRKPKPQNAERLGRQYPFASLRTSLELIARAKLTDSQKQEARTVLLNVLHEIREGRIVGFRMKLRGIHLPPKEGEGGQQSQWKRRGFVVWRQIGRPLKRDVIETAVECVPGASHSAIYPVKIVVEFLRLLTRPGDLVLDPFIGSGTTAIACKMTGRRYVGFELNPAFCRDAEEKLRFQTDTHA